MACEMNCHTTGAYAELKDFSSDVRSDARVVIPLIEGARSINVATAASIALFEALRQTGGLS